ITAKFHEIVGGNAADGKPSRVRSIRLKIREEQVLSRPSRQNRWSTAGTAVTRIDGRLEQPFRDRSPEQGAGHVRMEEGGAVRRRGAVADDVEIGISHRS